MCDKTARMDGTRARQDSSTPCRDKIFVLLQDRGWDWATMGRDKGFPCRDIVPLTSCCNTETVSQKSVAKAGRRCVTTG